MPDDYYERNAHWMEKQIREGDKCGRLYSQVLILDENDKVPALGILSIKQKKLRLEDVRGTYFRVLPEDVKEAVWSKGGLGVQLNIEAAGQRYRLRFWAPEAKENIESYAPKNWLGTLFPVFFINCMKWLAQAKPMVEANFAEAEKWRAVFPDAEFPDTDTEIKNA